MQAFIVQRRDAAESVLILFEDVLQWHWLPLPVCVIILLSYYRTIQEESYFRFQLSREVYTNSAADSLLNKRR
jgi:hypothetical protein